MTIYEIIKKLVGDINPIGESNTDAERFENLKEMCHLVQSIIIDIDDMAYSNRNMHQASIKKMAEYAKDFLTNDLGIKE